MKSLFRSLAAFFELTPKVVSLIPESSEKTTYGVEPTPPLALDDEEVMTLEPSSPGMALIADKVQSFEMSRVFDCPRETLQLTLACVPKERLTEAHIGLAHLTDPFASIRIDQLREASELVSILPTELLAEAQSLIEGLFEDKGRVRKIALTLPTAEEVALGDSKSAMRRSCREVNDEDEHLFAKPVMFVHLMC